MIRKALSVILLSVFAWPLAASNPRRVHVSLLKLVVDCEAYQDRPVTVIGAIQLEYEGNQLCPSRDFLDADPANCFWLKLPTQAPGERSEVTRGTYVVIDATVNCKEKGHGDLFAGTLENIGLVAEKTTGRIILPRSPK